MTVETTEVAGVNVRVIEGIGRIRPVEELSSREMKAEIARVTAVLARHHILVELQDGVPPRLVYSYLVRELQPPDFEDLGRGEFCHLTGCTGYCPGCFQRPWCNLGLEDSWPEDEETGRMVYPAEVPVRA